MCVPPSLRPWLTDVAHRMDVPTEYIASAALVRWQIELLTGTYVTLPIDQVVRRTGARDAAAVERPVRARGGPGVLGAGAAGGSPSTRCSSCAT